MYLFFRDFAELQRAERQRNARLAVTHALTIAATAAEAILQSLTAVCENLRWDTGLLWGVNEDGTALVYQASLQMPKLERVDFVQANKCTAFERGEGLPGRVWETGKPAWILEVSVDTNSRGLLLLRQKVFIVLLLAQSLLKRSSLV